MSVERSVVLLGAGGHARVLLEALTELNVHVDGFIAPSPEGSRLGRIPWLGDDSALDRMEGVELVNGVGSAGRIVGRAAVFTAATAAGHPFRTVVHPSAVVEQGVELQSGVQILAGAIVVTGARLGADVVVNTGAIVDHDSTIGDHSHVATGATLAGDVAVGNATHIGLGARVLQGINIGAGCVVGAGAVVLDDVPDGVTVVGVPARPLRGGA